MSKKKAKGRLYNHLLQTIKGIQKPLEKTSYAENIYWVYGLVLDKNLALTSQKIRQDLGAKGIGTRPFFYPMHKQPVFKQMGLFNSKHYPVADYLSEKGFYIPSGLALTEEQINQVSDVLKNYFKHEV